MPSLVASRLYKTAPQVAAVLGVLVPGLLLVSKHFLASRFIQDEELPRLLQRRKEEGLRVMPIIVRPCLWQSEPVLRDLQALPKDGKPVIRFSKGAGKRDQVWTEIATTIETRAKKLAEELT